MRAPQLKGKIVYLAGPMDYGNERRYTYQDMEHLAPWRSEIINRARNNNYVVPEMIEWWGHHHDIYGADIPYKDIELIRGCNALVAYICKDDQIGTFCEIGAARALGMQVVAVVTSGAHVPWFISELITDWVFPSDDYPDYVFGQDLGLSDDDLYQWAIEKLIYICGGETIDYHEYIRSPQWRERAEAAKERAGQRCQVCNRARGDVVLDAHHRTYARLGNERPDDITVLCRECHELYEKNKRRSNGNG